MLPNLERESSARTPATAKGFCDRTKNAFCQRCLIFAVVWLLAGAPAGIQAQTAVVPMARPITSLRDAAAAGDAEAQLLLGRKLQSGVDTEKNAEEGAQWIKKAADQGLGEAEYEYSIDMLLGIGVSKDLDGSRLWQQKAAEHDVANAQYSFGLSLIDNLKHPQFDTGLFWLSKAATHGHPMAQEDLALLLLDGSAGKRDVAQAQKWFREAASHDRRRAQLELARLLSKDKHAQPSEAYFWALLATRKKSEGILVALNLAKQLTAQEKENIRAKVEKWQPAPVTCDCVNLLY